MLQFKQKFVRAALQTLEQISPGSLIQETVHRNGQELRIGAKAYGLDAYGKVWLAGSGKASLEMARGICEILPDRIAGGCIVSSYPAEPLACGVKTRSGSHPIPGQESIAAAAALIDLFAAMHRRDLFLYMLSGGSSALIESPVAPLTLADIQQTTWLLLASGAPIEKINTVRKHLSRVKGGKLARLTKASGIALVISDVIGDDFETIGSGPLYCDRTTFDDACRIMEKYGISDRVPAVWQVLEQGRCGLREETAKMPRQGMDHILIGNNTQALKKFQQLLREEGLPAEIITDRLSGEASVAARAIVEQGSAIAAAHGLLRQPVCLLFGGETTVTLRGRGRGGRNQEMALAALALMRDDDRYFFLSIGTDGRDGPTDAAGAIADSGIYQRAVQLQLSPEEYLGQNDSYSFFDKTGGLITTGPTGTNVMDLTALLIW